MKDLLDIILDGRRQGMSLIGTAGTDHWLSPSLIEHSRFGVLLGRSRVSDEYANRFNGLDIVDIMRSAHSVPSPGRGYLLRSSEASIPLQAMTADYLDFRSSDEPFPSGAPIKDIASAARAAAAK